MICAGAAIIAGGGVAPASLSDAQLVAELDSAAVAIAIDPPFTDAVLIAEVDSRAIPIGDVYADAAIVTAGVALATDAQLVAGLDSAATAIAISGTFTSAVIRTEAESRSLAIDVPTVADIASLPTGISNGTVVDITSPAIRVQRTGGAWVMAGASGGGIYSGADLAALRSLWSTLDAGSVTIADLLICIAADTGIQWSWLSDATAEEWIPTYFFGQDNGRVSGYTVLKHVPGTDPRDAPASFTDDSIAVYAIDDTTTPGTVLLQDGDQAGRILLSGGGATENGQNVALLARALKLTTTSSPSTGISIGEVDLHAYVDGANNAQISIRAYPFNDPTNWRTVTSGVTVASTATAYGTDADVWMGIIQSTLVAAVWMGDGDADRPRIFDGASRHLATTARTLASGLGSDEKVFIGCGSVSLAGTSQIDFDKLLLLSITLSGS